MRDRAGAVADHLHLDVAGQTEQPFHIQIALAESGQRLRPAAFKRGGQIGRRVYRPHAAPAAARHRLHHDRRAIPQSRHERLGRREIHRPGAWCHGHAPCLGERARCRLVAEQVQRFGRGADENQPGGRAGAGERRVLRQEAIARMHRVAAGLARRRDQAIGIEIRRDAAAPQRVGLIGAARVQRGRVVFRVDRDRGDAHRRRGARDTDRDLAAVGDQKLLYWHRRALLRCVFSLSVPPAGRFPARPCGGSSRWPRGSPLPCATRPSTSTRRRGERAGHGLRHRLDREAFGRSSLAPCLA